MPWKKTTPSGQKIMRALEIATAILVLVAFAVFYWFIDKGAIGGQ